MPIQVGIEHRDGGQYHLTITKDGNTLSLSGLTNIDVKEILTTAEVALQAQFTKAELTAHTVKATADGAAISGTVLKDGKIYFAIRDQNATNPHNQYSRVFGGTELFHMFCKFLAEIDLMLFIHYLEMLSPKDKSGDCPE